MFGTSTNKLRIPARLVYVDDGLINKYVSEHGARWPHCRECTPEELALHGLTQPPRPWADRVTQWAIDRNIIGGTSPKDQFGKLEEEVKELRDAIYSDNIREIVDAIGDCSVVLTIIAAQYVLTLGECQEAAWHEIKDRKGRIINGTFVKKVSD
jgi:NTP pyrophosphatase (non-canonical NTP hydrolase)